MEYATLGKYLTVFNGIRIVCTYLKKGKKKKNRGPWVAREWICKGLWTTFNTVMTSINFSSLRSSRFL